jgi:type VI secretion system protein ImpL
MVWPNPLGVPGARITAITPEGRSVVLLNETGHFGLKKMVDAAQRKRKDNGVFELSWNNAGVTVTANLKIIGTTTPPPAPVAAQSGAGFKRLRLPDAITSATPAAPMAPAAPVAPAAPGAPAAPAPATMPAPAPSGVIRTAGAQP